MTLTDKDDEDFDPIDEAVIGSPGVYAGNPRVTSENIKYRLIRNPGPSELYSPGQAVALSVTVLTSYDEAIRSTAKVI